MRRLITGFALAAMIAVVPALALAGNQEIAERIANKLRNSGQLHDYKIGVKYQDGTAWLRGRVTDEQQMNAALRLVFHTEGVNRVVNELEVAAVETQPQDSSGAMNPLRGANHSGQQSAVKGGLVRRLEAAISGVTGQGDTARAQRVSSSFRTSPAQTVSAEVAQEMPQRIDTPQSAKPMQAQVRTPVYTAMMQPGVRGPVAPYGGPMPIYAAAAGGGGVAPTRYDQPCMPNYAWPSYAAYPNYAAVTYPKQYSPTAWPYIGPFYPYPQVPLGWRKVTLEWDDGWWFLDFKDQPASCWHR